MASTFRNVSLVGSPFAGSLAPSPRHGGVPGLPPLIEKPSAAMASTSHVAVTFCNVIAPPSFPGVTWSVAKRHLHRMRTPIRPSTIFAVLAFEEMNDCLKTRENNGQLLNRCNSDFFHSNLSLQLCQHQHAKQVLKGDRKLPDNTFSFRESIDSC